MSTTPLHPKWIVDRVAAVPLLCASSSKCRYLLSFLSFAFTKLASQHTVSSNKSMFPGECATMLGLRSVSRAVRKAYGCPARSATAVDPIGRFSFKRISRMQSSLNLPCWMAAWQQLRMCASVCLYCFPILQQMVQRSDDVFLHLHRLVLCGSAQVHFEECQ